MAQMSKCRRANLQEDNSTNMPLSLGEVLVTLAGRSYWFPWSHDFTHPSLLPLQLCMGLGLQHCPDYQHDNWYRNMD